MEELILLYYLRNISLIGLLILIYLSYFIFFKKIEFSKSIISIEKNQSIKSIIDKNLFNYSTYDRNLFKLISILNSKYIKKIHYGRFIIDDNINFYKFLKTITQPSNYLNKITIIEGSSKDELNKLLTNKFLITKNIEYEDIIADTYFLHSYEDFNEFIDKLINFKKDFEIKYKNHILLKSFNFNELLIIGSLLEKEGIDNNDKKLIFSVIKNRLNNKMRLQIDATVIYSLTDGKFKLGRKLNYNDLKVNHPYNTYKIYGLPPGPISYVGRKTIELIFENYNSEYLFYFYNNETNRHIYSKTYQDHKKKLNEYRNKK